MSTDVLISAISKKTADEYISVLNESGIDILALESHLSSISRSLELNPEEINIITKTNQDSLTFFVFKNNSIIFSRTVPIAFTQQENYLTNEINKIKNFIETEKNETINILHLEKGLIKNEYKKYDNFPENPELQSKWLVAIGAYIRGEIPNGQDSQISLLPIGVIEAYKYQKIKAFSRLIRNMIISISAFFLITFIATYLFIFSINEKMVKTIINIAPASTDVLEKESLVRKTNSIDSTAVAILSTTANWSILINEIKNRTIDGIIISNFSAPTVKDTMSIVGISKDRDTLNKFKKSLEGSNLITGVDLPITNLEKKKDIPFVISFLVKDPSLLYFK